MLGVCLQEETLGGTESENFMFPVNFKSLRDSDLFEYRKRASFDTLSMKKFIIGREYELKEKVYRTLIKDPLFRQPVNHLLC